MRRAGLVLLASFAACADMAMLERRDGGAAPACVRNSDCATGELCYADGCGSAVDFAVRVNPNSSEYVVQDFNPVSVAMSRMDLALQDPGIVEGRLQVRTEKGVAPYTGSFQLEARGRSLVFPSLSFDQPISLSIPNPKCDIDSAGCGLFSFAVPPGTWSVRAATAAPVQLVSGETKVEQVLAPVLSERGVAHSQVVDPGLVLGGSPVDVSGKLQVRPGEPWPESRRVFFRFQVLDPISMTALSQPTVFLGSSEFHVWASAVTPPAMLRVMPDPKLSGDVLAPVKDFPASEKGGFGPFVLGDWGEPIVVTGKVETARGEPLLGASVLAEGRVRGGGSYYANALTKEDGSYSLKLFPSEEAAAGAPAARYTVRVTPPYASNFSRTQTTLSVDAKTTAIPPLKCAEKLTVTGRVVGPVNGSVGPIARVPVVLEGNPASADPGPSLVRDVLTDTQGYWSAQVEPGAYRVIATPSSELPWAVQLVNVYDRTEVPNLELNDGRKVSGQVYYPTRDGQRREIAGATVTVYRQPTSASVMPLKLYEALTDRQGRFEVVLPKSPETTRGY